MPINARSPFSRKLKRKEKNKNETNKRALGSKSTNTPKIVCLQLRLQSLSANRVGIANTHAHRTHIRIVMI